MRIGSLFSGAGGLDMAVEAVFDGEVVWQSEMDKAASKVLAYRFPGVPNLGDITAVDWKTVEPVDVLCGGFPCQDVSAAGNRAGIKDGTRSGLWSVFANAIDQLRPPFVVIENVRGLLSARAHRDMESADPTMGDGADRPVLRAAGAVLGDLADLGYDAQWATVAAAEVGAPHRRERVFILACATDPASDGRNGRTSDELPIGAGDLRRFCGQSATVIRDGGGLHAPNPSHDGWDEGRPESAGFVRGSDVAVSRDGDVKVPLLPTPRGQDANGYQQRPDADIGNNGRTVSLAERVTRLPGVSRDGDVALLPTPRVGGGGDCDSERRRNSPGLESEIAMHYLPTPAASDATGGGSHPDSRVGHSRQLIDYALLDNTTAWGKYEPAIRRWEQIVGPAPAPTEPNKNGNPRLSAAFSEWMMGWPPGWVTDPEIGISRNDQLRIIGNGVCPQQAVAALRFLLSVSEVAA